MILVPFFFFFFLMLDIPGYKKEEVANFRGVKYFHTEYGIFHCDLMKHDVPSLNHIKICLILYENISHMGIPNPYIVLIYYSNTFTELAYT